MRTHSEARHDLVRAIARRLAPARTAPTSAEAARVFFAAAHDARCPRCGAAGAVVIHERTTFCRTCRRRTSLTASTPFARTKLPLHVHVAAIWHIHVDTETTSAAAFGRRYRIRSTTALTLLHAARRALIHRAITTRAVCAQILGRTSARNTAHVAVAVDDDGALCAAHAHDAPRVPGAPSLQAARELGRLHAWITTVFRGVTRRYLDRYLAEHADRVARGFGRAQNTHLPLIGTHGVN
jgi:hypothetical protein